ncbi:hypothetical protein EVAR_47047_1 [Eumeta japonica]|uniref:Uncharacterized protein n=1 Tax=Eumeta variegata TaxID=151549 RepID=A0A4C1ZQN1_EUMVA|nr:hypothetical protein EVAR_47047_1 [Eumeta japonica]
MTPIIRTTDCMWTIVAYRYSSANSRFVHRSIAITQPPLQPPLDFHSRHLHSRRAPTRATLCDRRPRLHDIIAHVRGRNNPIPFVRMLMSCLIRIQANRNRSTATGIMRRLTCQPSNLTCWYIDRTPQPERKQKRTYSSHEQDHKLALLTLTQFTRDLEFTSYSPRSAEARAGLTLRLE